MIWWLRYHPNLALVTPELFLSALAVLILLLSAFSKGGSRISPAIGMGGLMVYLWMAVSLFAAPSIPLYSTAITIDSFGFFFKILFAIASFVTLALAFRAREMNDQPKPEVVAFMLVLTVGMSMMASSTDLLMMYLSLEMVSILSYILVGARKHGRASAEAGLKYLLYGAMASGIMIFGFSFLYGLVGSTSLQDIAAYYKEFSGMATVPVTFFGLLCAMAGFGFKIATFPTQMWCPDVYEGAPTPVTAFLSVGPKAAGFAMVVRFFVVAFGLHGEPAPMFAFMHWQMILALIAAITMTLGNLAAIPQRNLKRLMAYSSIGHAGYLLMGLAALSANGIQAILFYLVIYLLMNFGAFMVVLAVADRLGTEEIEGYRGLGWRSPVLALTFSIFLFSLTGLPPFAGFIGKYLLFAAVVEKGLYWLAIVAVINSAISLFYYVRIIKAMYLEQPAEVSHLDMPFYFRTLAATFAIPILILGLFWAPLAAFTSDSLQGLF